MCVNKKLHIHSTELFEIELFICIKMDLALMTYKGWCAIKPNQTKTKSLIWLYKKQWIFTYLLLNVISEFQLTEKPKTNN